MIPKKCWFWQSTIKYRGVGDCGVWEGVLKLTSNGAVYTIERRDV